MRKFYHPLAVVIYATIILIACLASSSLAVTSGDAYITYSGTQWTFGTASVERVVALENGKFLLKSFRNKVSGREMIPSGVQSEEFFVGNSTRRYTGGSGWTYLSSNTTTLSQGELQLDVTLQKGSLQVTKTYVIHPYSSLIREWLTFKNVGSASLQIYEPSMLNFTAKTGEPGSLDLDWMTGGENQAGSWNLKTETLSTGTPRTFNSYQPFPKEGPYYPGDGINARITKNGQQVWPASGWQYVASADVTVPFDFTINIATGDKLAFVVNMSSNIMYDTTAFDPTIKYTDGETHTASSEFSGVQGQNGWRYQYIENSSYVDLAYYPTPNQWRKQLDNATGTPFIGVNSQHPDSGQDSARVWTATKSGTVRITGSICNTGNQQSSGLGFKPGTSSYAPWYALYSKDTKDGIFIGWDYFGHWASSFTLGTNGEVTSQLTVAGHNQTLAPNQSVTTPKTFVGLFNNDLDNAGNECLDWQYRYMWDYTRDDWFPAIRMLGWWWNGTGWGQPGTGWAGGNADWTSTFRKVFRVADLMRYCGADVYHRDWGWWDCAGDWNGPDWRTTINYLHKYDMGQLIYAFLYTIDPQSQVAQQHPSWSYGGTLDMSQPVVVDFIKGQLDGFASQWGNFEWRNDSFFTTPINGNDTPLLAQDQGFRQVMQGFLDNHPGCAFQAVNGGGNYGGYDYTRFASSFSFSDGAVGILRNYYASLLFPPDKLSDIPDAWQPPNYDKSTWRGLLCINFDMTGDTFDTVKLEGIRELIDIYHYLHAQGVVGRWVHVYRPTITGDDPTMYFQRLSQDGLRGIIIPKRPIGSAVNVKPKGLLPNQNYIVSYHESTASVTRTGADLMANGISLNSIPSGELIYLNLPLHPGSRLDTISPTTPITATKSLGENMGYPGVELTWTPGADNNWISYYEVFRNGTYLDKIAKGTFYFDHSAGADLAAVYEIRTVDGAGNASRKVVAIGPAADSSLIIDDAVGAGVTYTGSWSHQTSLLPAYAGTLSSCSQAGAAAQLVFRGSEVLLFGKIANNCGKVAISIDGGTPEVVDTYNADEIYGVCIYHRTVTADVQHTLRVELLSDRNTRSSETMFYLDGIRVTGSSNTHDWDASKNFSSGNTEGSAWSYGWAVNLNNGYSFTKYGSSDTVGGSLTRWFSPQLGNNPCVVYNPTNQSQDYSGTIPAGGVAACPSPGGQKSIIRWTAPRDGKYAISVIFAPNSGASTNTDVHVLRNGASLYDGVMDGDYKSYSVPTSLVSGNTVDFAVGFGPDGNSESDTTGINIVIDYTPEPPQLLAWDVAADFSLASNPNGQWSYGWTPSLSSTYTFNLYNLPNIYPLSSLERWSATDITPELSVVHNATDQPQSYGGPVPPGNLALHPGPSGQKSIVRWTAPRNDCYSVSALFYPIGGGGTDVHVLYNRFSLFIDEVTNSPKQYSTTKWLNSGDALDFIVGYGSNNSYASDATGLDAVIMEALGVTGLNGAKSLPDGYLVSITDAKIITAASGIFSDGTFYIEEPKRATGIKVVPVSGVPSVALGEAVTLSGILDTDANGERVIRALSLSKSNSAPAPLRPLGMINKSAASGAVSGILVRVWGRVKSTANNGYVIIDDGSGVLLRIMVTGLSTPLTKSITSGQYIAVTGLVGSMKDETSIVPVVRLRGNGDITSISSPID
ncbi:MAG: hypothetical protein ABFD54_13160 [Armatimonadota bacterium]|nr:hypothetical protein [bacterium]